MPHVPARARHPMKRRRATLQKLTAPRADGTLPRARVRATLERALRAGVVWVAAPAGYGKSTALADFVARRAGPCVWYRVDAGDRDSASFFHHLALALRSRRASARLPVFGPEYADQAPEFARRFFRVLFARLPPRTLFVLDDLHHVDGPQWDELIEIMLRELPADQRCACLSRTLPAPRLSPALQGRLVVLSQSTLEFSEREARRLVARHLPRGARALDIAPARGWAAGLVLLAEQAAVAGPASAHPALLGAVARQMFAALTPREQDALSKLSLLHDITPELASALTGSSFARRLLERLHQRQWLVTRGATERVVFQLHDLLRDFLRHQLDQQAAPQKVAALRRRAARVLRRAGRTDEAVELALQARDWRQARSWIVAHAPALLAAGQRVTLIRWSLTLPEHERAEAWLCYWLGVAHLDDDATAETWLARAWTLFGRRGEARGQRLAAAQAVLSKTDSWRTHSGLATSPVRSSPKPRTVPRATSRKRFVSAPGAACVLRDGLRSVDGRIHASEARRRLPAVGTHAHARVARGSGALRPGRWSAASRGAVGGRRCRDQRPPGHVGCALRRHGARGRAE